MKTKILLLSFIVVAAFNSCRQNTSEQSKQGPVAVQNADTMKMILATIRVKPGREAEFTEAFKEMQENTNKEEGCLYYRLYQDPYEKSTFIVVERYKNQAAIDHHFAAGYFKAFGPKTADLLERPTDIAIYNISEQKD